MRIPPIGPIRPDHGDHWWREHCWLPLHDHCCHDHIGHDCHGLVDHCCHDYGRHHCHDHIEHDHWLCRWPIPRNTVWEGKPLHTRHLPASWAGGIASTGENMSLAIAGVTNVDVYTRQNHTWHTGTVLAHTFSLARELQRIHHNLHHLRAGQLDQLQQAKQAATQPAAPDSAPAANPVPQPIDLPNANAAPAVDANVGPGAVLDVRV